MGPHYGDRNIFAINNTGIFLTLSQRLNEDLSITALQLFDPLIQTDNLPRTIEEAAGQYLQLIRENQPGGPYVLLGWCNGGTLAFEIARQLEEFSSSTHGFRTITNAWDGCDQYSHTTPIGGD